MDELKDMIALLKRTDFDPGEIDTNLHKRVADAIQDGYIKRFDMRVNSRDGDQNLSMLSSVLRVVLCYPKISHVVIGIS